MAGPATGWASAPTVKNERLIVGAAISRPRTWYSVGYGGRGKPLPYEASRLNGRRIIRLLHTIAAANTEAYQRAHDSDGGECVIASFISFASAKHGEGSFIPLLLLFKAKHLALL